jgi:outer membrane lipoprotein-sorting protein
LSGAELDALFAEWRRRQEETSAITARFACVETGALLTKPRTTEGTLQILKPDGYRRTTLDPKTGQVTGLMILKPPDLWVYLPALAEAEHYNLTALGGKADANPLKALEDISSFDAGRIRKRFAVRAFRQADGLCRLEYAPLGERAIAGVGRVRLWVKPGARFPEKMETAADGDLRLETYSETRFEARLDAALFKFRPPAGVKMTEISK